MNLLSLLLGSMTQSSSVDSLSGKTGISSAAVKQLLMLALPILLKSLTQNASSKEGAQSLLGALAQHKNDMPMADQLSNADAEDGGKIINHILGGNKEATIANLASQTGLSNDQVSSVLANSAPAILSSLSATTSAGQAQQGAFDLGSAASSGLLGGILGNVSAPAAGGVGGLLGSLFKGQDDDSDSDGSSLLGLLLGGK
jgi:hypothetical protein